MWSPTAHSRGLVLVIASVCIWEILNDGSSWLKMETIASIDDILIKKSNFSFTAMFLRKFLIVT